MKILAMYLPAYHQVKINDDVWGKGFTEWNNVKDGKKLFKHHIQPLEPLNDFYYDLSKKEHIEKQIKLANEYSVNGFIFYHYWFGNNVQALEKPAEILRDQIEMNIEYCFCWANHSWFTTWHGKSSKIIVNQEYGNREEWIKHVQYLIPFFKDSRYIKVNNRPVMYIYNMSDIKNATEMFKYWNEELKKNNLGEIYIVEFISSKNKKFSYDNSDGVVEFEPLYTTFFDISILNKLKRFICKKLKIIDFQQYDLLWKKNIKRKRKYSDKIIYKGCFCGWDNSARKGKDSMIVLGQTPEKFEKYLKMLILNDRENASNDFIIINAWNEWSEGAMLEPSKKWEYGYLNAIKKIVQEYGEKNHV